MRSFYKYLILLLLSHLMFSQNYIDVVYLNNGDIIKGIIIENSPGNHIKIETSNGSVITFDYDEIEKFQRVKQQSDVIEEIKPRIEKPNNKDKKLDVERDMHTKPSFFITIGQFFPSEESMKDIYGKGILSLGGGLRFAYSNSWNYQVGVDYISKKGDPYTWVDDEIELYDATSEIKIIPISFNSEYIFKNNGTDIPYVGFGVSYYTISEKLSVSTSYGDESVDGTIKSWGYHATAGIDFREKNKIYNSWGLQLKITSVLFESVLGDEVDLGGVSINATYKF